MFKQHMYGNVFDLEIEYLYTALNLPIHVIRIEAERMQTSVNPKIQSSSLSIDVICPIKCNKIKMLGVHNQREVFQTQMQKC